MEGVHLLKGELLFRYHRLPKWSLTLLLVEKKAHGGFVEAYRAVDFSLACNT